MLDGERDGFALCDRSGIDILSFVTGISGVSWAVLSLAVPFLLQTADLYRVLRRLFHDLRISTWSLKVKL